MYNSVWLSAVIAQVGAACLACALARHALGVRVSITLLAAALTNSLQLFTVPGYKTPLFAHDILVLGVVALIVIKGQLPKVPGGLYVLVAVFAWHFVGSVINFFQVSDVGWLAHSYRRLAFVICFLVGAELAHRGTHLGEFLDAAITVWLFMMVAGVFQYLGLINVDVMTSNGSSAATVSIFESRMAQRGFLGLGRGAVGVWGSVLGSYSLAQILIAKRGAAVRSIIHGATVVLSVLVILLSGSRTGIAAFCVGAAYTIFEFGRRLEARGVVRVALVGAVVVMILPALAPALQVASRRVLELTDISSVYSVTSRADVQAKTLQFALNDTRTALLGRGPSLDDFREALSTELSHPHSEYLQVLWESGFVGLALYIGLLGFILVSLSTARGALPPSVAIGVRGMIIAGLVAGLTVGFIQITSHRLAPFGMLMFVVFGLVAVAGWNCRYATLGALAEVRPTRRMSDRIDVGERGA